MKLRSYFVLLTLGTLLPVVVFGIIAAESMVDRERDALQRGMQERTLAMLTAVDAKLRGSIAAAEALAAASTLTDDNLAGFRKVAADVLAGQAGAGAWSARQPTARPGSPPRHARSPTWR